MKELGRVLGGVLVIVFWLVASFGVLAGSVWVIVKVLQMMGVL